MARKRKPVPLALHVTVYHKDSVECRDLAKSLERCEADEDGHVVWMTMDATRGEDILHLEIRRGQSRAGVAATLRKIAEMIESNPCDLLNLPRGSWCERQPDGSVTQDDFFCDVYEADGNLGPIPKVLEPGPDGKPIDPNAEAST